MTTAEAVISTAKLEKRYGATQAVRGLDLAVRRGEVFGLLGPNGAGKSTTILMLLGLTEPSGGSARVLGLDPARDPLRVKRQVGYLPDNVGFYGNLTARENLRYTCRLNGLVGSVAEERIERWLTRAGIADAADDRVESFSRGMRQRLGLADALVKEPAILILDEPTASIDPIGVREILDLVDELSRDDGVTVLVSSHLLDQVQRICDRIAIFVAGEVVAMGTVAELADRTDHGASVAMELGIDADAAIVRSVLGSVPGVTSVRRDADDRGIWLVTGSSGITGPLLRSALDAGLVPWLVKDRGMDLGDIYRGYFASTSTQATPEPLIDLAGVPS
jgi:ABC-2 type transport system ATP-binding protein